MSFLLLLSCLILFPFSSFSQTERSAQSYFKGSIDQMRQQAKSTKKPYILFFHADWSDPSKEVEQKCIGDMDIQQYLNDYYYLYKVELDTRATNSQIGQLAQLYDVSLYPTFIFFSPDGHILRKMAGQITAESFDSELRDNYQKALKREESDLNGQMGDEDWIPEDFFEETDLKDPDPKVSQPDWESFIEDENSKEKELELEGPSQMYAVQLGAYTKPLYAQRKLDEVQRSSNFPAEIIEQSVNGIDYFKVIVGPYSSKAKAEQQRLQVVQQLGDGAPFVISIARY